MTGRMATHARAAVLGLLVLAANASEAQAQWSTTILPSPAGATWSTAHGVSGWHVVGEVFVDGVVRPLMWTPSSSTWVDLTPVNAGGSGAWARAVHENRQVGSAEIVINEEGGTAQHAGLWSGSADSWVDLHPGDPNVGVSEGFGLSSDQQVGIVVIEIDQEPGANFHASLWSGTPGSWIDLHPAGATDSWAWGVSNGWQVGRVDFSDSSHAALWHGSAASYTDLNPPGAAWSWAVGISSDQQVGQAFVGGEAHASLWSGSASTWVDLHPQGLVNSGAMSVFNGRQAGFVFDGVASHAAVWYGIAGNWDDLHAFLPPDYTNSQAEAIWSDSDFIYVAGMAWSTAGLWQAVLWTRHIGGGFCLADFNHDGFVNGDDYDAFAELFELGDLGADLNHDGFVNGDDYDTFAEHFEAGC